MDYEKYLLPEFKEYLKGGYIREGLQDIPDKFFAYISDKYPLVPVAMNSVDWTKVTGSIRIDTTHIPDTELKRFIDSTTVGNFNDVALVYDRKKPAFVMSIAFLVEQFDELTAFIPHVGYFVALSELGNQIQYHLDTFLEWEVDNGLWLSGVKK